MGTAVFEEGLTGIEELDEAMDRLLEQAEDIALAASGRHANAKSYKHFVQRFLDHARTAFDFQEKMMEACTFPNRAAHKQEHRMLLKTVKTQIDGRHKDPENRDPIGLSDWLVSWLNEHLRSKDKPLGVYYTRCKIPLPSMEERKALTRGRMSVVQSALDPK